MLVMYGYPLSEVIVVPSYHNMTYPRMLKKNMLELIMPQLIIAGFTTVTVASVVAGFVVPLIFYLTWR